jgi:hypothetical protein
MERFRQPHGDVGLRKASIFLSEQNRPGEIIRPAGVFSFADNLRTALAPAARLKLALTLAIMVIGCQLE